MATWLEYTFNNEHLQGEADRLDYTKPLHMTLVHFPRDTTQLAVEATRGIVNKWVRHFPKQFNAVPLGAKRFDNNAVVIAFFVPSRIQDQRLILITQLFQGGIRFSNNYDWNPHVTVGEKDHLPSPVFPPDELKITGVALHHSFGDPHEWKLKP